MSETGEARRTATLSAHVPQDVAAKVRALAQAGERSISREITRALRRHVATESSVPADGLPAGGSFAGTTPAARRGTSNVGEAVEPAGARGEAA
jgi:predicted transcriptional regulator